jgi:hypothetical protein
MYHFSHVQVSFRTPVCESSSGKTAGPDHQPPQGAQQSRGAEGGGGRVSDAAQLEKIRKHAEPVPTLGAKLRYWDYQEVQRVHDALAMVNESINSLGLVPQGF